MNRLNLLTVDPVPLVMVTCTILLINSLWYAPFAFGGVWQKMQREQTSFVPSTKIGFIISLLTQFSSLWMISALEEGLGIQSFFEGFILGLLCGALFMGSFTLSNAFFFHIPLRCWALDFGHQLCIFAIGSGALTLF